MYTKGEWIIKRHGITYQIYVSTGQYQVAEGIYRAANANLIAAAPDMYEALKATREWLVLMKVHIPLHDKLLKGINEALEKAGGRN